MSHRPWAHGAEWNPAHGVSSLAIIVVLALVSLPVAGDEWWRDHGANPWSSDHGGESPWGGATGEAWWVDPPTGRDPWRGQEPWQREDPATHPWTGEPKPRSEPAERQRYDPWSDWTDRPWANIEDRRKRESERTRRDLDAQGRRPPAASPNPAPPYPGYGPVPWGGMPWPAVPFPP